MASQEKRMSKSILVCDFCDKKFASKSTLTRHYKNVHKQTSTNGRQRFKCPFECLDELSWHWQLIEHLKTNHSVDIPVEELEFASENDFLNWKYEMENETLSKYIKEASTKTLLDGTKKVYFLCHRSYTSRQRLLTDKDRKRAFKSQGTKKTDKSCPSRIEVVFNKDLTLSAVFWKGHCGHTNDLGHLSLDKPTKDYLARKLRDGVTFEHILDEVRSEGAEVSKRTLLLERRDLHNIVRDYNIAYATKRHSEDAVSVQLWVQEMMELGDDSPVLFYKPQGEEHPGFEEDEFVLILMTHFQASQILKFGSNKICIDSTHGTNGYDIQLTTLMTVDEFGAGCPVAFCFSSKCDESCMALFFDKVKEKVGAINATSFMSDDAPAFYNAWCNIMGRPIYKLLCSWHVDRCWRKNLMKVKGGSERRALVYKTMKVLLKTPSKEEFNSLFTQATANLLADSQTSDYGEYVIKNYSGRPEQWAYCYRLGLGINTNMYLEAFHRTLKHVYLEGKKIKRLDKTINAVMKIARDSLFKRLIKLSKQTVSERILKINQAHKASVAVDPSAFSVIIEGEEWVVTSSNGDKTYKISKSQDICSDPCMRCSNCNICIHSYKCSCHDNVIKMNICKHIHACYKIFLVGNLPYSKTLNDDITSLIDETKINTNVGYNQKLGNKACAVVDFIKKNELNKNDEVCTLLEKSLDRSLSICNNVLSDSKSSSKFLCQEKINVNKHIEPQVRLFSTKKKSKCVKRLKNPTYNESVNIIQGLQSGTQEIIHVHTDNDHTYNASFK